MEEELSAHGLIPQYNQRESEVAQDEAGAVDLVSLKFQISCIGSRLRKRLKAEATLGFKHILRRRLDVRFSQERRMVV
jgi:hypothetical protein